MEYKYLKELKISRLGLGTVQFGFNYGINNKTGQVPYPEIVRILETALKNGVNFLDTSRVYGVSEENIGRALKDLDARNEFVVCTKLDLSSNYKEKSEKEVLGEAGDSLEKSLEALGLDSIPVYLLHDPEHRTYEGGIIWDFLKGKTKSGIIKHPGVSIAEGPSEAIECFQDPAVEAIQIPYNVFDGRWRKQGVLKHAEDHGIAIFNRSSYLQGLLLMDIEEAENKVPGSRVYKQKLNLIAKEAGYDLKEIVLKYVFAAREITSTIIGTDSNEQFKENISLFENKPLEKEVVKRIEESFQSVSEQILNPRSWEIQFRS